MRTIQEEFTTCAKHYKNDPPLIDGLWQDLKRRYETIGRYYHNLDHLDQITDELIPFKHAFTNWNAVVFAIAYHDVIYSPVRNNNEKRSADFAGKALEKIGMSSDQTGRCRGFILATKNHTAADRETDLFTDADLSIFGTDPSVYTDYSKKIRQEYHVFPDLIYKPGRRKVLLHFLNLSRIFKTEEFASRFEEKARKNLADELEMLQ